MFYFFKFSPEGANPSTFLIRKTVAPSLGAEDLQTVL